MRANPGPRPVSPGVKAGSTDDNAQFGAFLRFLTETRDIFLSCDVSERIIVSVNDAKGLPLADAEVVVRGDDSKVLAQRRTYADGRTLIFPSESAQMQAQSTRLEVTYGGKNLEAQVNASGKHQLDIRLDLNRPEFQAVPLDVAFVLDTTGSMGDEIDQLKKTIEVINFQVSQFVPKPDIRFGMVLYRDIGDEYRTKVIPFTGDLAAFTHLLAPVEAGGGGDTPEDVQQGLEMAMKELAWRENGVKVAFLIGDAPPHLDYKEAYTYVDAMHDAARRGIKIAAVGCSGLDRQGETVWRQLAQYTMAPFVFLTRGEKGNSEGSASSVSHHLGSNWNAENLDTIVVRMLKLELSHYTPTIVPENQDYFEASLGQGMQPDPVLEDLFVQACRQLVDYCVQRLDEATPTLVLPVKVADPKLAKVAEKLEGRITLGLSRLKQFQLLDAKNQPALKKLVSAQYDLQYDVSKASELGKLVPAKLAVFSELSAGAPGKMEMMIKLVRLETGEILSVSLLKMDQGLLVAQL